MEIVRENIPNPRESIELIITSSLLRDSSKVFYNKENNPNTILINSALLEYNHIYKDSSSSNNELFPSIISNKIQNKKDLCLLILSSSLKHSNIYLDTISNFFSKNFFEANNIKSIKYIYYKLSTSPKIKIPSNEYEIIEINSQSFSLNIPEMNTKNLLLKIEVEYNDMFTSLLKIIFIHKKYDEICPYFCLNRNIYQNFFLEEKIKSLLSLETFIKKQINNLPLMQSDLIENFNEYKNEIINYYSNFISNIEKLENENISKNDLDDFIIDTIEILKKICDEKS